MSGCFLPVLRFRKTGSLEQVKKYRQGRYLCPFLIEGQWVHRSGTECIKVWRVRYLRTCLMVSVDPSSMPIALQHCGYERDAVVQRVMYGIASAGRVLVRLPELWSTTIERLQETRHQTGYL